MRGVKNATGLLLLMSLLLFSSCEKVILEQESSASSGEGVNVVLTVADVESYVNGDATRGKTSVEKVCTRLCFAVYQNGQRVKYDNQKSGDSDFGTVSMQLEAGSYQLLILAHSGDANPSTTKPTQIKFTNQTASGGTGFTDTFYYYGDLEVTNGMPAKQYVLERATAMFRLIVKDKKPSDVKRFYFYYTGGSGQFDATTGYGNANSQQKMTFDLNASTDGQPLEFELYTFPHDGDQKVTFKIEAQNADGQALYTKELKVPMERNFISQFSGNFFTEGEPDTPDEPGEDEEGSILVDTTWDGTEEYTY